MIRDDRTKSMHSASSYVVCKPRGPQVLFQMALLMICSGFAIPCLAHAINSPNGRVGLSVGVVEENGQSTLNYSLSYDGDEVLIDSAIRFGLPNGTVVGESLSETSAPSVTTHDSTWKPVYGEQNAIRDHYKQLTLNCVDEGSGFKLQFEFRCYDAGAAFRAIVRPPDDSPFIHLATELSEFRFAADHTVWCTQKAQGPCEVLKLSEIPGAVERPLTVKLAKEVYAAILEAGLVDYAAMKLRQSEKSDHALVTSLLSDVKANNELRTPWRVVMVAASPGELLENNELVMNLSEPCAIADTSWIKPGKVLREITLTTQGAKASVDFAAKHNFQYVEFDAGWYGQENHSESDATTVTLDPERSAGPLNLLDIIQYANERGIGIIVYVNRRALEKQLDEILPMYKKWGIKGVKYGFVNTGSQKWTTWLHNAVQKAAEHELMVDVHDEYRPVGYSRTYPNLMTQEGVRGDEAAPSSEQAIITLFTRNLAGAADHTICYFDPRVSEHWTHGHQLAKAVCTYSPWQFMFWYDTPLSPKPPGKHRSSIIETPELEFFAKVPTVWDETKVLCAEIGEYAVIARRSGQDWFVGSMNNGTERELDVPLDFLMDGQQFRARVYRDDPSVDTPTKIRIEDKLVEADESLSVRLGSHGGQAMWLTPSSRLAKAVQAQPDSQTNHESKLQN